MPGILPMKVIRIGNNSQSRIAQACDRCRSKKIRCDGIRPCCTQCANVGFECKTSDKLSRRAFPRGYTESLEDRVRGLEAEVRELKDLLDEKDEKIDMLSRIHNFSPSSRKSSSCLSPGISAQVKAELESAREDALHVETAVPAEPATPSLGSSSMAAFMTAFDDKVQESGRQVPNILPMAFAPQAPPVSPVSPRESSKIPPRLLSDQYINLFFQEWQPLLPIFHRPTFLRVYEQYLLDPEARQWHSNKQAIAQLYLVFDISAQSSTSRSKQSVTSHEPQWRKALHSISANASLSTLQCHVLAELYYLLKADYAHLARHRAIAVSMCHQLGLHQCQNYPSLPVLEAETRKKVFWCQYVLDKFTSAATGTPMLFREADITTEYPADVDDENVSIQGFSPTLPGEITKLSSALALFKASRILSKTLEQLYPAKASYQLSLTKLHAISDELDQWSTNLPAHLRLQFCKDKPSTNVISCRSPLLFLAYFYIRSLIHRPIVCHGSGSTASASTIVLAAAAKHVVQIFDLLDERRLNYTFPLNKTEFLLSSGFSLLWQCLDLEPHSKLVMDNQKSLTMLIDILSRDSQTAGCEFLRVASSFVTIGSTGRPQQITTQAPRRIDTDASASRKSVSLMPAPPEKQKSTRKQLQAIASRLSAFGNKKPDDAAGRRATVPREAPSTSVSPHPHHRAYSSVSVSSTRSAPVMPMCSPVPARLTQSRTIDLPSNVNLDYFPIGEEDSHTHSSSTTTLANKHIPDHGMGDTSWEQLLTNIDNSSMYSGIYTNHTNGSVSPNGVHKAASSMSGSQEWATPSTDETWPSLSAIDLSLPSKDAVPQSVLSFSEESLTSQEEDLVFSVASSNNGSTATSDSLDAHDQGLSAFKGIAMPTVDDEFDFHDLDGSY